jgi:hypothetical protein
MHDVLEFAYRTAGLRHVSRLALIGYSAGCQRVRALRLAGVSASAYLLVDGTHANWPPAEWQIAWLRELATEARHGRILVVATHTLQTYTEKLPPGRAFASTVRVLRAATAWPLDRAGPLDRPAVTGDGALWVYSYASAEADAPAHAAQLVRVVPELCARHLGPWLQGEAREPGSTGSPLGSLGLLRLGLVGLAALFADE